MAQFINIDGTLINLDNVTQVSLSVNHKVLYITFDSMSEQERNDLEFTGDNARRFYEWLQSGDNCVATFTDATEPARFIVVKDTVRDEIIFYIVDSTSAELLYYSQDAGNHEMWFTTDKDLAIFYKKETSALERANKLNGKKGLMLTNDVLNAETLSSKLSK